jgi:transcriptional regulator with XRE-family HTH domain
MDVLDQLLEQARTRQALPDPPIRRLLRTRAGLTQAELAVVLGVDRVAVSRYESGGRTPRGAVRERYVAALARLAAEEVMPHS